MKKYLLRILTVLLIVCFGACLFAACGGDGEQGENPDDQPATYTLTYQANGGTGADITEKHKEGEKVTLKGADTFTYEDHTFTGWNDGTTTHAAGGEFTMPANNVTMKAQWEENGSDVPTYTVKVTDPSGKAHVEFDKQGPYHKGDVVKFTVDFAPGENLRVTSVKADGVELQKGTDGKYSVTFAEKDIEIVIASESTEAHEFTVSLTVSGEGNGNSAELDKKGTVGKDEKVTLTVVTAEGYSAEVKLNGNHVDLNAEGKYELTVTADAAFTVTFTKNGENPPAKTYTVTCTSQHVTVKFDQNGPYNTGTVVTFTITAEAGYEIVSVKNGSDTLQEQNGKYSVTVGEADIVITVETREVTTPQPQGKEFKEFLIADIQRLDAVKFQISIQAKAEGYTSPDEMKADVKLLIGTQEFSANLVTLAESGIYNLFFPVEIAQLTIAKDASAPVKLKSTAAGKTYDCPATSVNETLNSVQFEHDIYTLQYASNVLTLKHTREEVVEKKITFAGTTFEFDAGENKIYLTLNLQTVQGYEEEAVLAAKLKIGTLEFTAREGISTKNLLRFDLTGGTPTVEDLAAEKYAVVLVVGSENYECPTVMTGQVGKETKDNRTYTLNEESGKLYLTVEGSSVTPPPSTGYTVTYTGEHVTVTFEKNGPYEANTVVYFTVTVDSGYKLVSVKNGDTVLTEENGKYSVTVTDANIVLTIETAPDGTTPQPSDKALKEFADSNVLGLNDTTFQLILRAKADGYATVDELKADVKLLIGLVEFEASDVTKADSGIYNLFFHIEVSKLADMGDSAEVKLKLISANQTYDCPATAVNDKEFQVQFEHDIYTLKLESGKLVLAHTYETVVEKKITFADTTFDKHGTGEIYLMLNITTQGYEAAEIEAAKLKVGELTFAAITDPANKSVLRFDLTGGDPTIESLTAEKYAVVLVVGSEEYPCPSLPNAGVKTQEKDGKTFKLQPEEGKLYLTVEGGTPAPQLDPIEGVWTGAENLTLDGATLTMTAYVKKGDTYIDFLLEMKPFENRGGIQAVRLPQVTENDYKISEDNGLKIEVRLSDGKLIVDIENLVSNATFTTRSADMGSVTLPASGTYRGTVAFDNNVNVSVTFGAAPEAKFGEETADNLTLIVIGKYIVCFEKEAPDDELIMARLFLTAGADENTLTGYYYGSISFTLTKEGTTPTEKEIKEFGSSEIGGFGTEGFRILLRAKATGYTVDTLKAALKIKVDNVQYNAQEVGVDNDGTYRIYFLIKNEEAAAIQNGDHKVTLIVDGQAEEVKAITSEVVAAMSKVEIGGKTYSLKAENNELTLTVAGESTPPQPQATFTATGATLEVSGEKVCFVLSGTATGLADANAVKAALSDIYFDLQELNTQNYQTTFTRTVTVEDPQDGVYSWKIEFDISSLEAKANAYIAHFQAASGGDNPGVDLKLTVEQAVPNTTVQNSAHKFTLLNDHGQTDAEHNWGCVAVKVETLAPQPAVQTTVTFDVDGDTTKVSPQTYDEGNTFQAPAAPTKENYTFLYWYYLNDGQETKVEDGFVPSDHDDENHKLTLYAKWEAKGSLGTVTANGTWNTVYYAYPEQINVGDVAIFSGDLQINHSDIKYRYNGIFAGIVKGATLTIDSNYVSGRYDYWAFTNDNSGLTITAKACGFYDFTSTNWVTVTGETEADTGDFIDLIKAGNIQYKAIVNYIAKDFIELRYELTANFTPTATAGVAAGEHTFYMIYEITGTDIGAVSVGLCGEKSTLSNAKIEVKSYPQGLEDLHVTYENYEGTLTEISNYKNNDTDGGVWWGVGTDDIQVNGDFAVVFVYDKVRDYAYTDLSIEFNNASNKYFNWNPSDAATGGDDLGTAYTWTVTARTGFAAQVTKHGGDYNGHAIVKLMRVGAKMQVSYELYDFATGEMIYAVDAVCGNFITEALTIRLNGNPFWIDNVKAYSGTLASASQQGGGATKQSAVISSGETLVYEATVGEIGSAEVDGIVAQLNIGENGKYVRFCPNGLYINSDDGEEEISLYGYSERKMFNGAELAVEASIDLPQLLNAKKKA